ncbi:cation:proton antiporter domain-containing protein [Flavobacterium silvaticum]|uniref:Cation/H(+) antiporter n=1 Tax=Flavobacterium silvaticum TaxID=1852020 RepID=A0A972FVV8_9FLAO|nr:cation:proton antiporter [Flavobacterium silvaticum]NMH28580.1 cation/H(+) antiporter [Flavobacterium silvaticum]
MKGFRNSVFYVVIIGAFSALIYLIVSKGKFLEVASEIKAAPMESGHWNDFVDAMAQNLQHPLALLLAQIITIIFAARLMGWFCRKIGQPSVIGEIIAGIMLGPSLIGMYFPEFSAHLFPKESLGNLQFLSQIGLIFFMYVIGMELNINVLKNKAHEAVVISHASIIFPFTLGVGLAYYIYSSYAPTGIDFLSFSLFIGISMSITAFPVLARIVQERGIHKTRLGAIVITCAAADDITAWCILAAVIAIVKAGSFLSSLYIIGLAILYVLIMLQLVRPFLKHISELKGSRETLNKPVVAIFFLTLLLSAYVSELIGIHALFGAFMAGAVMPENTRFRSIFIEKVEDVAVLVLLPLFFVFTGLRTQIGLIDSPEAWKIAALVVAVAVTGKFLGSALAAKFVGQSWKDSLSIGALMNTRGLMELIVLNIGYDLGVLSSEIFTILVLMALVTTFMTGPSLDLINFLFRQPKSSVPVEVSNVSKYRILVAFSNIAGSKPLLTLADSLTRKQTDNSAVTALHLSLSTELHAFDVKDSEREFNMAISHEAEVMEREIEPVFKVTNDIENDVIEVANQGRYDLLLIGLGRSIFEGTLLGKVLGFTTQIINPDRLLDKFTGKEGLFENSPFDERTRHIVAQSKMPVGIFLDKDFKSADRIFVPVFSKEDVFLVEYVRQFIHNNGSQVIILDAGEEIKNTTEFREKIRSIEQIAPNHISVISTKTIKKEFLDEQQLMVVSLDSWKKLVDSHSLWLNSTPSVLIVKP